MAQYGQNRTDEDKKPDLRADFMSEEEMDMIDQYLTKLESNRSYMSEEYYTRWEKEQEAYAMEQPIQTGEPNSRVNIINANIEGQVSALVEQNLAVSCRGEGPSDHKFASWANTLLDWTLRKNQIRKRLTKHERRRELNGPGLLKIHFDQEAIDGFGLVRIETPSLHSVFIDTKIKDDDRVQDADYVAEVMSKSKVWAKEMFGDMAEHINYGDSDRRQIFVEDTTTDDEDRFWYIQWWCKTDGKLRLIEFSEDGVLLRDSFKTWDEDKRKFNKKDNPKPFYRYNQFPYFLTNCYFEEGKLFGFGDGKLLRPLQELLNDLYDQVRVSTKPDRVIIDPASELDPEELDEGLQTLVGNDPKRNVHTVSHGEAKPALWQLLNKMHEETQRVTRFSELMMGQKTTAKTATEAAIQQAQGSAGIDHKKLMLQLTLQELCAYALDLMMEHYTRAKAFRVTEESDDFEWIDPRQMNEVPIMIPAESGYTRQFNERNIEKPSPKWQLLTEETDGETLDPKYKTRKVELDIEITLGAGLPKNKAFLSQMLIQLAAVMGQDKHGQPKPVIYWEELRKFFEDYMGLPIESQDVAPPMPQMGMGQQGVGAQPPVPTSRLPGQEGGGAPTPGGAPGPLPGPRPMAPMRGGGMSGDD